MLNERTFWFQIPSNPKMDNGSTGHDFTWVTHMDFSIRYSSLISKVESRKLAGALDSCFVLFGTFQRCAPTEPCGNRTRDLTDRKTVSNRCATNARYRLENSSRGQTDMKIIGITSRLGYFGLMNHHNNLRMHAMNYSFVILPSNCENNSIFEWLFRYEITICRLGNKLQCPNHDCHDHELESARQLLNSCIGFHTHGNQLCTWQLADAKMLYPVISEQSLDGAKFIRTQNKICMYASTKEKVNT